MHNKDHDTKREEISTYLYVIFFLNAALYPFFACCLITCLLIKFIHLNYRVNTNAETQVLFQNIPMVKPCIIVSDFSSFMCIDSFSDFSYQMCFLKLRLSDMWEQDCMVGVMHSSNLWYCPVNNTLKGLLMEYLISKEPQMPHSFIYTQYNLF